MQSEIQRDVSIFSVQFFGLEITIEEKSRLKFKIKVQSAYMFFYEAGHDL